MRPTSADTPAFQIWLRNVVMTPNTRFRILTGALFLFATFAFAPGLSGPFLFDDYSNLIDNSYIKITSLDAESIRAAATSLESGPLGRPVSLISFAVNYYFAGHIRQAFPYKIVNLAIHLVNALILAWVAGMLFRRLAEVPSGRFPGGALPARWAGMLGFSVALLWFVHPIQIGSVLYVVQRMNQLSTLFVLLGTGIYLHGRLRIAAGQPGVTRIVMGIGTCGVLGALSKENALLLPLFILLIELVLFSQESPWRRLQGLMHWQKQTLAIVAGVGALATAVAIVIFALPGYASRTFTMTERLLTEARVVFFYIGLILVPRINAFGNQHDDIVLSESMWTPWTTLPAIAGHAVLIFTAIILRRRVPLVSLGMAWFYVGHLMESTVIALEIAHEHRNYLPSAGIFLAIVGGITHVTQRWQIRGLFWLLPALAVIFGLVTLQRASQWGDYNSFYRFEVMHHPNSPRTQAGLAILLEAQGDHAGAIAAQQRAAELDPRETGYLLQAELLRARRGLMLEPDRDIEIRRRLQSEPLTGTTFLAIQQIANCIQTSCKSLSTSLEGWLRIVLSRHKARGDISFYYYALGLTLISQNKIEDAIHYFNLSHEVDPKYLHPLFAIASIYVQLGKTPEVEAIYQRLQEANARTVHRRDQELKSVERDLMRLRRGESVVPGSS